jgi:hypothetical protein
MAQYIDHIFEIPAACPRCRFDLRDHGGNQWGCAFCTWVGELPPGYRPAPPPAPPPAPEFIASLDLGCLTDFTAFVGLQKTPHPDGARYEVRSLCRFALGTPYPAQVEKVVEWMGRPPYDKAPLVLDRTGVGVPVSQLFTARLGSRLVPVMITGGASVRFKDGSHHVAKSVLVSHLQKVLSTRRLAIADSLPEAKVMKGEFKNFTSKITPKGTSETFEGREGAHDDLLLALTIGLWLGETRQAAKVMVISGPPDPALPGRRPWSGLFSGQW